MALGKPFSELRASFLQTSLVAVPNLCPCVPGDSQQLSSRHSILKHLTIWMSSPYLQGPLPDGPAHALFHDNPSSSLEVSPH